MSVKNCLFYFFALVLMGCTAPVRDDEINWRLPILSKQGCPDLTGKYYTYEDGKYPTGDKLFVWLTGGFKGIREPLGIAVKKYDQDASPPYNWTVLRQTNVSLEVSLVDQSGRKFADSSLDMKSSQSGCHNGALIVHRLYNLSKAESGTGQLQYYETEFRKLSDGSLLVRHWYTNGARSNLTGKATGKFQESFQTRTYPLVRE